MSGPIVQPAKPCVDCLRDAQAAYGHAHPSVIPKRKIALKRDGTPQPGPRCVTHWRERRKAMSEAAHAGRLAGQYGGLTKREYNIMYDAQGGHCAVLRCRATGKSKRLAVEHDHACERSHGGEVRRCCIRGLVCADHNTWIGRAGDDPEVFDSLAEYLRNPPARAILSALAAIDAGGLSARSICGS